MSHVGSRATATAATLVLALGAAACGSDTDKRAIAATFVNASPGFYPETVTVDKEDRVDLRVGNGTDRQHGFSIEGYRVRRTVEPNQSLRVRFRASRAGTFRIFCQLHPTHQPATLIVR
jgi:nitrosocyanin